MRISDWSSDVCSSDLALARLQGRALEHVHPDREEGLRQAGRLLQREALGHRQALRGRRHAVLGIAAAGDQRADLVSQLGLGYAVAQRYHLAGDLEAGEVGGTLGRWVAALALQAVRPVRSEEHTSELQSLMR